MYLDIMCFVVVYFFFSNGACRNKGSNRCGKTSRAWIQALQLVFLVKPCLLFPGGTSGLKKKKNKKTKTRLPMQETRDAGSIPG